jgi:hypothetical protein
MISKTLSPENQMLITCPVFRADVRISSCFTLRDLWARGEGPPVRQGCQVALNASKCPISAILTRMIRLNEDIYHSTEPKKGALDQKILAQIGPTLIQDRKIDESGASDLEKKAMHRCNAEARDGSHSKASPKAYKRTAAPKLEDVAAPAVSDAIITAAATGDMSAAINTETSL